MSSKIELLTNKDLEELAAIIHIPLVQIASRDTLSIRSSIQPACYIINLDRNAGTGTHWVCLFIKNKQALYFDSFGQPLPTLVAQELTRRKIQYECNMTQIQDLKSTACGWYTLAFLHWMCNGGDIYGFIEMFDQLNQKRNDKILQGDRKSVV